MCHKCLLRLQIDGVLRIVTMIFHKRADFTSRSNSLLCSSSRYFGFGPYRIFLKTLIFFILIMSFNYFWHYVLTSVDIIFSLLSFTYYTIYSHNSHYFLCNQPEIQIYSCCLLRLTFMALFNLDHHQFTSTIMVAKPVGPSLV